MEEGVRILKEAGVESAWSEIELIMEDVTGLSRSELYLKDSMVVPSQAEKSFKRNVSMRRNRVPLQYVLGQQGFRYLQLQVNADVLIPRPETELVVEAALGVARVMEPPLLVADVGTGSGAIALSIARELPGANVLALDISTRALSVARQNASIHGLSHKIAFVWSDLLSALSPLLLGRLDVVVANLPYVATGILQKLAPELFYEPPMALDGGEDGLRFYPPLIEQAHSYLRPRGALVLELGESPEVVRRLLAEAGFVEIDILPDFGGQPRIALGYKAS